MIVRWLLLSLNFIWIINPAIGDHDGSDDPLDWLRNSIPGEPGVDYPIFADIEDTSFSCNGRIFGGYYADPEMQCQGYHVCLTPPNAFMDRKTSFLCPNGTIFSQSLLTCDWWFNVDCSEAEDFYNINEKIGSEDPIATDDNLASKSPNRQQASQTNQRRQRPQNQPQQPQTRPQQGQGRRQQRPQASKPSRGQQRPQQQSPGGGRGASKAQSNRPQNQRRGQDSIGVGSASIQNRNKQKPQVAIDIVQYDATIPDDDEDIDVPILLADPFREAEEPLALYGAPPRGGR